MAVVAPLEISPAMIMWDRPKHPDVHTIADLGRAGVPVLYYQTDTYMQYLLAPACCAPAQVDGSYDGSPSRWVTAGGEIAQAGFATSEPYIYKNELGDRSQLRRRLAARQRHRLPDVLLRRCRCGPPTRTALAPAWQARPDRAAGPGRLT